MREMWNTKRRRKRKNQKRKYGGRAVDEETGGEMELQSKSKV